MALKIFNTATRRLATFVPLDKNNVRLFVCGPTVYGPMHAGHAKTYTQFDLIATVLRQPYPSLRYVQNITDVDDKVIARAKAENITVQAVALFWEKAYKKSMAALGNFEVNEFYRAHAHVDEVIAQVARLLALGKAYEVPQQGIYYDLSTLTASHTSLSSGADASRAHGRVEQSFKKNPGDFVLWKFTSPEEPSWPASFGRGRPGWHIEDTAITEKYLGQTYDIHGGATDLIFPHHEAEIAQMEGLTGKPLVNYWLHTGLLSVQGQKMGKSLNNFVTVDTLLAHHEAKTLRYGFLSQHYRSSMEMNEQTLQEAKDARTRVENFYHSKAQLGQAGKVYENFWTHLLEDFNTPKAFASLFAALRYAPATVTKGDLEAINKLVRTFEWEVLVAPLQVQAWASLRQQKRGAKMWAEADILRSKILEAGWEVRDEGETFVLRPL